MINYLCRFADFASHFTSNIATNVSTNFQSFTAIDSEALAVAPGFNKYHSAGETSAW